MGVAQQMAYEKRGSKAYYYRAKKQHGRVVKEYIGRGPRAQKAALEANQRREIREQERATCERLEALETRVAQLDKLITLLALAHMIEAGLYQHHRGEWRKRKTI
jgi:hypothetical protein